MKDQNRMREIFEKHSFGKDEASWFRTAIHIDWENLNDTFSQLLSDLLGRDIVAESDREEYYYWRILFFNSNMVSKEELETLFEAADADDFDRDQNDIGEYPVSELCQSLCDRFMNKLLPFNISHTKADEDGVWFIGCADKRATYYDAVRSLTPKQLERFLDQVFLTGFNIGHHSVVDSDVCTDNPFNADWVNTEVSGPAALVEDEDGEGLIITPLVNIVARIMEFDLGEMPDTISWHSQIVLPKGEDEDEDE